MSVVYEALNHWVQYGRPGGTQSDYDVVRGTNVIGRFDTREAAEAEIRRLQIERQDESHAVHVDEVFDEYEIREVEGPEAT